MLYLGKQNEENMKSLLIIVIVILLGDSSYAQWVEQTSGITKNLKSISSPDNDNCWASGDSGVVIRTTNGGLNWQNVGGGSLGTYPLHNIFAVDANIAMVSLSIGTNALVFRTTNGGTNWVQQIIQSSTNLSGMSGI